MPPIIAGRHRRKVRFPAANLPPSIISTTATFPQQQQQQQKRPGKKSPSPVKPGKPSKSTKQIDPPKMTSQQEPRPGIPALFTQPPPIRDPLVTETIELQNATLEKCLTFLKGLHISQKSSFNASGVPALERDSHVAYLYDSLEDYPAGFVAMDASRPWMVYWALAGLTLLGEDPTRFRER
jgi:protein farnesyltransferase subunit beta